jgi:hypothetical protein
MVNHGAKADKSSEPLSGIFSGSSFLIFTNKNSFVHADNYWIHSWLPGSTPWAVLTFMAIGMLAWLFGLVLSNDKLVFLHSREWQVQPLYLAGHLFTAWMFVLPFTKLFHRALESMEGPKEVILSYTKVVLGPQSLIGATVLAIPFLVALVRSFLLGQYEEYYLVVDSGLALVDIWMMIIWAAEWWINSYIWFILIGFIGLTLSAIKYCTFKGEIEEILIHEKYKPFLLLIVQGSTSCLFFFMISSGYVWYAEGELDDYIGLGLTLALLVFGFTPPWVLLRHNLERQINLRTIMLGDRLAAIDSGNVPPGQVAESIAIREFSLISRIQYLDRLKAELGQKEGRSVILRLLIPALTFGWEFLRPFLIGV